jgi:hypothetical protein
MSSVAYTLVICEVANNHVCFLAESFHIDYNIHYSASGCDHRQSSKTSQLSAYLAGVDLLRGHPSVPPMAAACERNWIRPTKKSTKRSESIERETEDPRKYNSTTMDQRDGEVLLTRGGGSGGQAPGASPWRARPPRPAARRALGAAGRKP